MKRELTDDEQTALEEIMKTLTGFTVEQAEAILRAVSSQLKERAVIE